MLALNDALYYFLEVLKVAQAGHLSFRQPKVIEEAIISSRTHCQPRLLIVHLYCVPKDMCRRVPESILIEGYSFEFARRIQRSVVEIE